MKTPLLCICLSCVFVLIPDALCADKEVRGCVLVTGGTLPALSKLGALPVQTFHIGKTEVTWGEWQTIRTWAVANGYTDLANVGQGVGDQHPVTHVNWYDVVKWCNARSEKEGKMPVYMNGTAIYRSGDVLDPQLISSANGYRLPSEKEWEFAARGGIKTRGYTYSGSNDLNAVGWYSDNAGSAVHEVGKKLSNELEIYDMSGNLWEWTGSWNPSKAGRLTPGGSLQHKAETCAIGNMMVSNQPERRGRFLGFRVALSAVP
jgi:sulfatase modifying factor 1